MPACATRSRAALPTPQAIPPCGSNTAPPHHPYPKHPAASPSLPHTPQSPNELQDLLDATRLLLDELEAKQRAAAEAAAAGGGAPAPDPDTDELREKFRIMKVLGWGGVTVHSGGAGQGTAPLHAEQAS